MSTTTIEPEVQAPPEVKTDPASQMLWDAADYLEEHGWCQFVLKDKDDRVCAVGALQAVADVRGWWHPGPDEHQRMRDHCVAVGRLQRIVGEVHVWNDVPGRRKKEVVDMLRQASEMRQ
jgi:hypothetical protein